MKDGTEKKAYFDLSPHETSLVMLCAHVALRSVCAILLVHRGVVNAHPSKVRNLNIDRGAGSLLEAEGSVPRHVLDRKQRPVRLYDEVEIAVADEHAVGTFDNLWKDVLYRIWSEVSFAFWAGTAFADEDIGLTTLRPGHIGRCVNGSLDLWTIEVNVGASGRISQSCDESKYVPE